MATYVIATNKRASKFIGDKLYIGSEGLKEAKDDLEKLRKNKPDSASRFRIYPMNITLGDPVGDNQ